MQISDPRYAEQWHFALLGGIETVWADYSGADVRVGVYDDGMDQGHAELAPNYDPSLHFSTTDYADDGTHAFLFDGHGTAVAGLIGAARNGEGGVGVAWGATLTSVTYLGALQYADFATTQLAALRHMGAFDVVNMSYGTTPDYDLGGGGGDLGDGGWAALEAAAMAEAVRDGRGGLGTILVKAAGNDAHDPTAAANGLLGHAQGEGQSSLHSLITVAATQASGAVTSYSNYGHNLLIAAPAASVTTDVRGVGGYDFGDDTTRFGGTSAATPLVSGVVALMLDANPGLGARDVQDILAISAAQTGSAYGGPGTGWEVGAWQAMGGAQWNGGAMTYHQSYGFGMVDAHAAVRMAEVWHEMRGAARIMADLVDLRGSDTPVASLSDLSGPSSAHVTLAGAPLEIEHLYIEVDLVHARAGDLRIELIAPDGTDVLLFDHEGADRPVTDDWTFGVTSLRGMSSAGVWQVRVTDNTPGHDGVFLDATVTALGHTPGAQDIWTVTEDFPTLAAVDPGRARFHDTDGGQDWLNLAALTDDARVTLGQAGADGRVTLGGSDWITLVDGTIENVASGDGDDALTGNGADNAMLAGRGRNIVTGAGGTDALTGMGTADVLVAEARGLYGTAASAQVWRLFDAVFGREPATAGHQLFTAQLLAGTADLLSLARGFMASPEFAGRYGATSDTDFVTLLYRNVLDRAPDAEGLRVWNTALAGGMTRESAILLFSESNENMGRSLSGIAAFERAQDPTAWADDVYRAFTATFGREPAAANHALWCDLLASGATGFDGLVQSYMNSTEFTASYGGTSDAAFIDRLFLNVLGRPPAQAGLDDWTGRMTAGMSRLEVIRAFANSAEYVTRTAEALRDWMQAQPPDDTLTALGAEAVLSGGLGADTFVFHAPGEGARPFFTSAPGADYVVTDLEPWDQIRLEGFGYADVTEALSRITASRDTTIFEDQGVRITFLDSDPTDWSADMFVFV